MTKGKADTVSKEVILGKYLSNYFDNVPEEHKGEMETVYNQILKVMEEYAQAYAQTESKSPQQQTDSLGVEEAVKEVKAVWVIIDKKQWVKDNKSFRVLHGCWLSEENAELFAKKTYGEDYEEWVLITPLLVMENNTLEKALQSLNVKL